MTSRKAECDRVACSECAPLSTLNQRYSLPDLDGLVSAATCKVALWGDAEGKNTVSVTGEGEEALSRNRAITTYKYRKTRERVSDGGCEEEVGRRLEGTLNLLPYLHGLITRPTSQSPCRRYAEGINIASVTNESHFAFLSR